MPQNTNHFILTGRIVDNLQERFVKNETAPTKSHLRFTIAVDRLVKKDAPENAQTADFIPLVSFGRLAETITNLCEKGDLCNFEGRITSNKYTDKNGNMQYSVDHVVEKFLLVKKKKQQDGKMEVSAPNDPSGFASMGTEATARDNVY